MRAVVQRVKSSSVSVQGKVISEISKGINILIGISKEDSIEDAIYMKDKILNLRIFEDDNDKMNLSLLDIGGEVLIVSQFTLYGDCRKGRRPNFMNALSGEEAEKLYEEFVKLFKEENIKVATGIFGEDMNVKIENDGPVTLIIDSKKNF